MQKLFTYLILSLLIPFILCAQQSNTGGVKGNVKTSDNKPAAYVTIIIRENKRSTITDEEGNFLINRLPAGNYHAEISLTGYETLVKEIVIQSGTIENIFLSLQLSEKQLEVITIVARNNRFIKSTSPYAAKMPLKNIENPQVYTTITQALLESQVNVSYADALKNVPGVIMMLENNSAGGSVTSRGFSTQSFLRNGVPGIVGGGSLDPANIESVEAIKGPSGTLFGSSLVSFGGLFNRVTKKPTAAFGGNVSYTAGGFGLNRLTADVNTPLDKEHKALLRTNAAFYREGSFQDAGFKSYVFLAPSFTYHFSDKTQLNVEAEYKNEKANSFYRLFADGSYATGVRSPKNLKIDWKRRFSGNDIFVNTITANIFVELKHRFSEQWTSQTLYTYLSSWANGSNGYMSFKSGNDSLIRYFGYTEYSNIAATNFQQNFVGDFKIGKMRNRLLLGLDVYSVTSQSNAGSTIAFDVVSASKPGAAYTTLNKATLLDRIKGLPFTRSRSVQNTYAAYVQDVLNITDRFLVLASVRVDRFENRGTRNITRDTTMGRYEQTAISTRFGAVYQIIQNQLSLFGNYMNGFQNIAPVLQPDGNTSTFKPSQANQWEFGVKASTADGKLAGSISYYNISVKDITRADAPERPAYTIQNGTQNSKGIEADITANLFRGCQLVVGYAYNNSKLEKSSPAVDGLRPVSAGPEHLANLWIQYQISTGKVKGLGFGFGGNYGSENKVILSTTSLYTLPSFAALGASVNYDKPRYRIAAKVDNLTNQQYWVGWGTTIPQMPCRFSAAATIKF